MWKADLCERRKWEEEGDKYVVEHFVHGEETREEAAGVGYGHFVRDAGRAVGGADDAVVCWIE
jgi:hypothetical protein